MVKNTASRPGRPKSKQKSKAVLDAATELFLKKGFQGVSMDAVAYQAGVSKQTVYSHFANKEELFAACIRAKVTLYGFDMIVDHSDDDLRATLLKIAHRVIDLLADPEVVAAHRVVICEAITQPKTAALFFENGPQRMLMALYAFLDREKERGRLNIKQEDLVYASKQFLFGVFGMYQLEFWLGLRDHIPLEDLGRHLSRVVDDFLRQYSPALDF